MSLIYQLLHREENGDHLVEMSLRHPCFADHVVRSMPVLPGVTYLELALAAAQQQFPSLGVSSFEDCVWVRPVTGEQDPVRFHVRLKADGDSRIGFELFDSAGVFGAGWMSAASHAPAPWPQAAAIWRRVTDESVRRYSRREIYAEFARMGIDYGRHFRRINYVDVHENKAVALLSNNDAVGLGFSNLLDGAFQSGMAVSIGTGAGSLMPFSLGMLVMHQAVDFKKTDSCYAVTEKATQYRTNIGIFSEVGTPLVSVFDLGVKPSRL